ncbi:hypothetical protein CYLTODRAFT_425236 [Cylindrobasidium torrendii FP15055 ss-10]|uniref:cAMP-independent regulatory protein pac2 n=1 Tax=Cylindrobasidium torrendii FP15055 ss-10 TaxID=1314674 RepID=A0A0D7B1Q4_9AGAR|nr:hypothetical protein CYLTODRAFT_425236 [Cylindrobasidium torrendii FP15055 ss-10]
MSIPNAPQRPTLEKVRIRTPRDAFLVFTGVAMNALPLITRRLDIEERRAISSGNVYVWEERSMNTEAVGLGMERWTDGMSWGPSRVRDEFLYYHQKNTDDDCGAVTQTSPWAHLIRRGGESSYNFPGYSISSSFRHFPGMRNLVKQTYSVYVNLSSDRGKSATRKWHLTAYFNQDEVDSLQTLDRLPSISSLPPNDWFRSARTPKNARRDRDASARAPTLKASPSAVRNASRLTSPPMSDSELSVSSSQSSTAGSSYGRDHRSSPTKDSSLRATLVPLEHLQKSSTSRRDPLDEQLIRRFSPRC